MRQLTVYTPHTHLPLEGRADSFPAHRKIGRWVSLYGAEQRRSWLEPTAPTPVEALYLVHQRSYVADQERHHPDHALAARWACETHLLAARTAFEEKAIVCAPVSGFHHARYRGGGGYCVYNGLALTVRSCLAREEGPILILDGDAHYGDGTADILAFYGVGERTPFEGVTHVTRKPDRVSLKDDPDGKVDHYHAYKAAWERHVAAVAAGYYKLVLYQAGADAWKHDQMGAGWLSRDELRARDRAVFDACVASKTPCVWNFAGGYNGDQTAMLHAETHLQAELACMDDDLGKLLHRRDEEPATASAAQVEGRYINKVYPIEGSDPRLNAAAKRSMEIVKEEDRRFGQPHYGHGDPHAKP